MVILENKMDFNGYQVLEKLRCSIFSQTYRVEKEGQSFILKLVDMDTVHAERLKQEAGNLERIAQENEAIPKLIETFTFHGELGDYFALIEEEIEGQSLEKIADHPLSPSEVSLYIRDVLQIVTHLHSQGFYVLDLKPEHIIITPDNKMKIIDLGSSVFSKTSQFSMTLTSIANTLGYGHPQYLGANINQFTPKEFERMDKYGIAAIGYRLLSGFIPDGLRHVRLDLKTIKNKKNKKLVNVLTKLSDDTFEDGIKKKMQQVVDFYNLPACRMTQSAIAKNFKKKIVDLYNVRKQQSQGISLNLWGGKKTFLSVGLYSKQQDLEGLTVNLFEDTKNTTGETVSGLLTGAEENITGVAVSGCLTEAKEKITGVAVSGCLTKAKEKITGVAVSGVGTGAKNITGVVVSGCVTLAEENITGVAVSGLLTGAKNITGVAVSGWGTEAKKITGVAVSVVGTGADNITGVAVSGLLTGAEENITGVVVSGITNVAENNGNGVLISPINYAKGTDKWLIQFGLINIIKDNPVYARCLPIINARFNLKNNNLNLEQTLLME